MFGVDIVSMGFWVGDFSNESREMQAAMPLSLNCGLSCFGLLINSVRFLDTRAAPLNMGCIPSLLIKSAPKSEPIYFKTHVVC